MCLMYTLVFIFLNIFRFFPRRRKNMAKLIQKLIIFKTKTNKKKQLREIRQMNLVLWNKTTYNVITIIISLILTFLHCSILEKKSNAFHYSLFIFIV